MTDKKMDAGKASKILVIMSLVRESLPEPVDDTELKAFVESEQFSILFPELHQQLRECSEGETVPVPESKNSNVNIITESPVFETMKLKSSEQSSSKEVKDHKITAKIETNAGEVIIKQEKSTPIEAFATGSQIGCDGKSKSTNSVPKEIKSIKVEVKQEQETPTTSGNVLSFRSLNAGRTNDNDHQSQSEEYRNNQTNKKKPEELNVDGIFERKSFKVCKENDSSRHWGNFRKRKISDSSESDAKSPPKKNLPVIIDFSESSSSSENSFFRQRKRLKLNDSFGQKRSTKADATSKHRDPVKSRKENSSSKMANSPQRHHKPKNKKVEKKVKLKPFSYYKKSAAKPRKGEFWEPNKTSEFDKFQRKYKLKLCSIPCVDLLKFDTFFHKPTKQPKCLTSMPLKPKMHISDIKLKTIEKMENIKMLNYKKASNLKSASKANLKPVKKEPNDFKPKIPVNKKRVSSVVCLDDSENSTDSLFKVIKTPKKGITKEKSTEVKITESDKFVKALTACAKQKEKKSTEINLPKKYTSDLKNTNVKTVKSPLVNNNTSTKQSRFDIVRKPKEPTFNTTRAFKPRPVIERPPPQPIHPKVFRPQAYQPKPAFKYPIPTTHSRSWKPDVSPIVEERVDRIRKQINLLDREEAAKPQVELFVPKIKTSIAAVQEIPTIKKNDTAWFVAVELSKDQTVEVPTFVSGFSGDEFHDYLVQKIVWWILKNEAEPANEMVYHPELHDDEKEELWFDFGCGGWSARDDDDISLGAVSDDDSCLPDDFVKPKYDDPDRIDEYCGLKLLDSHIRRDGTTLEENKYKKMFSVQPGTNYEKAYFNAKCFLCDEKVVGQRPFGAHVRSKRHQNNFRNYSLKMANYEESQKVIMESNPSGIPAKLKVYSQSEIESARCTLPVVESDTDSSASVKEIKVECKVIKPDDDIDLPRYEDFDLKEDIPQKDAKLTLRMNNRWNIGLEDKWTKMKEEETMIIQKYNNKRPKYIGDPESHPKRPEEWNVFWNRRSEELEAEGKEPNDQDLASEWIPFWLTRIQDIMKAEAEEELYQMKKRYGMDSDSLKALMNQPVHQHGGGYNRHRIPGVSVPGSRNNTHGNGRGRGPRGRGSPFPFRRSPQNPSNNHQSRNPNRSQERFSNRPNYHNGRNSHPYNSPSPNRRSWYN